MNCNCGCGQIVKESNRFINGHNSKGKNNPIYGGHQNHTKKARAFCIALNKKRNKMQTPCKICGKKPTKKGLCDNHYNTELYKKNPVKFRERHRKHYHEHIEEERRYHREWSEKNKDRIKLNAEKYKEKTCIQKKKYYLLNKERIKKYHYVRRKTPAGRHAQYKENISRRANILNAKVTGSHTLEEWMHQVDASGGVCEICDKYVGIEKLAKDHIIPLSHPEGSSDAIENIQPVCISCNSSKGGFKE